MFGLTFEKLVLVAIVAGVVIGPQRLPVYAQRLAELVRSLRVFLETTRSTAEAEMGVPLRRSDWEAIDLRQYDPRRIVRDALDSPDSPAPVAAPAPAADPTPADDPALLAEAARVRPGQRYLVTGSAAHPRRVLIESLPPDDPRRLAADVTADVTAHVTADVRAVVAEAASGAAGEAGTEDVIRREESSAHASHDVSSVSAR